jgi:threonine/homoserine/homoserine lactone efflux protein
VAYTPGPNNVMSMNNAKNVGFRKGIHFNLGIFAGFFVVMILCLLFSAVLYTIVPKIQLPMKILGAGYMVYLISKGLIPRPSGRGFFIKHKKIVDIIIVLLLLYYAVSLFL